MKWITDVVLPDCTQELTAMIDLEQTGILNSYSTLFKLDISVRGGTASCWSLKNKLDLMKAAGTAIGSCTTWVTQVQPAPSLRLQFNTGGKINSTYERYGISPELIQREWNPLRMYVRGTEGTGVGVNTLLHTWSEKNGHYVVRDVLKKKLGPQSSSCEQICAELDS